MQIFMQILNVLIMVVFYLPVYLNVHWTAVVPADATVRWCWERLRAGGEGDDRVWDSWMASPTQWTWVWLNSGSWWWTGRPGMLQSMGSQRIGDNWSTVLNWTEVYFIYSCIPLNARKISLSILCIFISQKYFNWWSKQETNLLLPRKQHNPVLISIYPSKTMK